MTLPDIDSLATFGGQLSNYAAVEDPTTDRDAAAANKAYADTAAMTATAMRCWARFSTAATTGDMVLLAHGSVWGVSVPPVLARISSGEFTITFPATVTDELSVVHSVNLRAAACSPETNYYFLTTSVGSARVISVSIADTSAAQSDAPGDSFFVWAI